MTAGPRAVFSWGSIINVGDSDVVTRNTLIITVPHEPWFRMGNLRALKNISRFGNPIDHINHWSYAAFATFLRENSEVNWELNTSFPWIEATCIMRDKEHEG